MHSWSKNDSDSPFLGRIDHVLWIPLSSEQSVVVTCFLGFGIHGLSSTIGKLIEIYSVYVYVFKCSLASGLSLKIYIKKIISDLSNCESVEMGMPPKIGEATILICCREIVYNDVASYMN